MQVPDRLPDLDGQSVLASDTGQICVCSKRVSPRPLDDVLDLVFPVGTCEARCAQRTEGPDSVPCILERESRLPFVDAEPDTTLLEQTRGELVDADEVDAVDQFGRVTLEERREHLREGADVGSEQHATGTGAGDVGDAVDADHVLAGAGGSADTCRSVEVAADELGLRRVEEGHPLLDGCLEDAVEELSGELGVVDDHRLGQVLTGEDRLRHDQLLLGGLSAVDDGEVGHHSREDLVNPDGRQPRVALRDVTEKVADPDDVDRGDVRVNLALAGDLDDRVGLARREADLGEGRLCSLHEVREAGDVVGDVLLPAVDAVTVDGDFALGLGVDDEDPGAADDDHVDLGVLAPWPPPVREEVIADAGKWREGACRFGFGALGNLVLFRTLLGFVRLPPVFVGSVAASSGYCPRRGIGDGHDGAPLRSVLITPAPSPNFPVPNHPLS